jgi:DNA-binding transcriptional LysR family regulator
MDLLSAMTAFVKVVDAGGFTPAARDLSLPKSTVSRQITALEERLGVRLLERTTRSVRPTEAGRSFYERCARIVSDVAEAEDAVMQSQREPRGTLRVSVPVSLGVRTLGPMLGRFLTAHPGVHLEASLSDRRVELVEEGFDLAIRVGQLQDSSLIARRLAPAPMVMAASPAYLAARGTPSRPEDLRDHACLQYEYARTAGWRLVDDGREIVVPVSGPFVANNGDILRDAAVEGLGLTMAPDFILRPELASGRLVPVLEAHVLRNSAVWAVYPESRHLSTKVRAFVDALVAEFGALSGDAQAVAAR